MRLVAGRHRGRRLVAPPGHGTRPTSDRVREALFNLLAHSLDWAGLAEAHVADIFCGTGAVGLEALSRGAAFATFVDNDPAAIAATRANIETMGEGRRSSVLRNDATGRLRRPAKPVDLVYLDPPYREEVAPGVIVHLNRGGWLADGALCVTELHRRAPFEVPEGFEIADDRTYGDTRLLFLRKTAD